MEAAEFVEVFAVVILSYVRLQGVAVIRKRQQLKMIRELKLLA
jgi:hypothetical protein